MWTLTIENIAGIRRGQAAIAAETNVVQASNFAGKSSLLAAIGTVMGTTGLDDERHPLTQGASEGTVGLETETDVYETTLSREAGGVVKTGETYLTDRIDRVCARSFAFLGENNPVRAAVRDREDLSELLIRPLDLEDIDAKIATRQAERREVESDIDEAKAAERKLISVQERITELETELEELEEKRATLEAEQEGTDRTQRTELETKRTTKNKLENRIDSLERKLERSESRLDSKQSDLADLELPEEPARTEAVSEKRDHLETISEQIELLESVYGRNKRVLDENRIPFVSDVDHALIEDSFDCWVCGSETNIDSVESQIDSIQSRIRQLQDKRGTIEKEVERMEERRREYTEKSRRKESLEEEIAETRVDIEETRTDLEELGERRDELADEIADLEAEVEAHDDRLSSVRSEIKVTRTELEEQRERRRELRETTETLATLRERREEITEEIHDLKQRRQSKTREIATQFEAEMNEIVDLFAPSFERAWLDPKTDSDGEIERYELMIARDGGRADLDTLSESEQELIGIVAALAGYKTYDVGERVPVMLLDGIGALERTNLRKLIRFLDDQAEYLVTTAYPEAGEFEANVIRPEQWTVVSTEEPAST